MEFVGNQQGFNSIAHMQDLLCTVVFYVGGWAVLLLLVKFELYTCKGGKGISLMVLAPIRLTTMAL